MNNRLKDRKTVSFETELNFMIIVAHNEDSAKLKQSIINECQREDITEKIEGILKCGVEANSESTSKLCQER